MKKVADLFRWSAAVALFRFGGFVAYVRFVAIVAFVAIGSGSSWAKTADAREPFAWPASLAPMGNGYPRAGNACRRLGESAATSDYLDHTATLVGCPGGAESPSVLAMLREPRAHVVGAREGVTLISIPRDGAIGHDSGWTQKKRH